MRKVMFLGVAVLWLSCWAHPAEAQVNVEVGIQLPPPLFFPAPPQVIVLPDTYIYVVPDISEDIYFYDGFWWRPWDGHWYRSYYYDQGWGYYPSVPGFYFEVHQNWRHEYRNHHWNGQPWNYEHISHHQVQKNWSSWKKSKHWEKNNARGIQGSKPRPQPKSHASSFKPQKAQQPHPQHSQVHGQPANRPQGHAQPSQGHQIQGHPPNGQPQQQQGKAKKKGGKGRKGR